MLKPALAVTGILAAPVGLYLAVGGGDEGERSTSASGFTIPSLSTQALDGKGLFSEMCGSCHGAYGEGGDNGPPLIHALYSRAIFPDETVQKAIVEGAMARNWPFGDMPPVEGLGEDEIEGLVAFVREVQDANGID